MKIAITSTGKNLDASFDQRFGRAMFFIVYNMEDNTFEAFENPNVNATGGAGIQAAQFVVNKGVKAVISGDFGPKASQALSSSGIEMIRMNVNTVREAINAYRNGDYEKQATGGAGGFGGFDSESFYPPPYMPYGAPFSMMPYPKEAEIHMLRYMRDQLRWQLKMVEQRLNFLEGNNV